MSRFAILLAVLAPIGCSSSPNTSTAGQMISCTTEPTTGVILRCTPTAPPGEAVPESGSGGGGDEGSGSGSGGGCIDVDEDGDGEPHDTGVVLRQAEPNDQDGDGVDDAEDCDSHPGEDDNRDADLPYDVKPQLGQTATPILDAFLENGSTAPTIVSVTMDGGDWRLTELQTSTPFEVTQDDCDHAGNRSTGRDRVFVTWTNATGGTSTDHLDIRYCDGN